MSPMAARYSAGAPWLYLLADMPRDSQVNNLLCFFYYIVCLRKMGGLYHHARTSTHGMHKHTKTKNYDIFGLSLICLQEPCYRLNQRKNTSLEFQTNFQSSKSKLVWQNNAFVFPQNLESLSLCTHNFPSSEHNTLLGQKCPCNY